jgi:hypothetical protein
VPGDRYPAWVEIYRYARAFLARKGLRSLFAGGDYVHVFETPVTIIGLDAGTVVTTRDGQSRVLPHRTMLWIGDCHVWGYRTHVRGPQVLTGMETHR